MTEGDDAPAITPIYSGLVNGDTAAATAPTCSTTADSSSAAGHLPVDLLGRRRPELHVHLRRRHRDGRRRRRTPVLTITASSADVELGGTVPAITPIYSGLVNGDTAPDTAPTCIDRRPPRRPSVASCPRAPVRSIPTTTSSTSTARSRSARPTATASTTRRRSAPRSTDGQRARSPPTAATVAVNGGLAPPGSRDLHEPHGPDAPHNGAAGVLLQGGTNAPADRHCTRQRCAPARGRRGVDRQLRRCTASTSTPSPAASANGHPDVAHASSPTCRPPVGAWPHGSPRPPSNGIITYVQSATPTGTFDLTYGICRTGTATYSASRPELRHRRDPLLPGVTSNIGGDVTVSSGSRPPVPAASTTR